VDFLVVVGVVTEAKDKDTWWWVGDIRRRKEAS